MKMSTCQAKVRRLQKHPTDLMWFNDSNSQWMRVSWYLRAKSVLGVDCVQAPPDRTRDATKTCRSWATGAASNHGSCTHRKARTEACPVLNIQRQWLKTKICIKLQIYVCVYIKYTYIFGTSQHSPAPRIVVVSPTLCGVGEGVVILFRTIPIAYCY